MDSLTPYFRPEVLESTVGHGHPPLRSGCRRTIAVLVALTALGLLARLILSAVSFGTNDAISWRWFAALTVCTGPSAYGLEPVLNHPPIPVLWSILSLGITALTDAPFPFVFRLPAIVADAGSCLLLWRVWRGRAGERWAWVAAAAMAWNLNAVLVGAYHCNTDNVVAFLSLLSAYLLATRDRPGWAGLALAAAINVKIVPVLLVPPLLSACGNWRAVWRFLLGLSAGAIPFLLMFAATPAFAKNVLGYVPSPGEWGLTFFALNLDHVPLLAGRTSAAVAWLGRDGKYLVFAASAAIGLAGLIWRRRWSAYELAAATVAAFLVLTPGFGVQYTVYAAPLILAVDLRRGAGYGLLAGAYVLAVYAGTWDGTLPLASLYTGKPNPLPVPIGLAAWAALVGFLVGVAAKGFERQVLKVES